MRIIEIKYEHKVPRAQYESELLGLTAIVSESDDVSESIDIIMDTVNDKLLAERAPLQQALPFKKPTKVADTKKEVVTENKVDKSKTTPDKKVEAVADKKVDTVADKKEAKKIAAEKKAAEKKEAAEKKAAEKKEAKELAKLTIYDRSIESHKKELSIYLNAAHTGWEKDTQKAAKVSHDLNKAVPLYSASGDVAQEFKDAVDKGMK